MKSPAVWDELHEAYMNERTNERQMADISKWWYCYCRFENIFGRKSVNKTQPERARDFSANTNVSTTFDNNAEYVLSLVCRTNRQTIEKMSKRESGN